MSTKLQARARQIRQRATVRAWEYRQRHHSKGVWFRFRRALVDAESAWSIGTEDADRLERDGFTPLAVGDELEPRKRIFFVSEHRLEQLPTRTAVPLRLAAELLAAENLVLLQRRQKGA